MPKTKRVIKDRLVSRFETSPVVDAPGAMVLNLLAKHRDRGKQGDPENCAIAECAKDAGATRAEINRSTAYIEMVDEDGDLKTFLFQITPKTRAKIEHFDETGEIPQGAVVLQPPRKSISVAGRIERNKKYYERKAAGVQTPTPRHSEPRAPNPVSWRTAGGRIRFIEREDEAV